MKLLLTTLILAAGLGAQLAPAVASPAPAASPVAAAAAARAASPTASQSAALDPRTAVARKIPGAKAEDLHPTPIPGIYELMRGTDAAYVSADGKYAIVGDLYETASNNDLTEARRRDARLKMLATIPESQMLIFGSPDARHTVTVFTDVDCQYCRRLHSQIAEYNRLGIRVRYIFYPRTGPNTESWTKAEQVWCSPDRKAALTQAKLGRPLSAKPCANNPVAKEYELGQQFDLQGTPSIVLGNGDLVAGYLSPQEMAAQLKTLNR